MLNPNPFKNKFPIRKRKKEIFSIILITSLILSTIFYFTYIHNTPIDLYNYPRININYEDEITREDFVNCTFDVNANDESDVLSPINARIKIRGSGRGWNAKSPKKEFRIELSQQISVLGMREDDDWQLLAMYYDLPRTRIKLSIDLWGSLEPTNPTAILPKTRYVCLFLNGDYQGLYLLAERTDRRLFDLDASQANLDSSLIFQASFPWHQDWPNDINIMNEIMTPLFQFFENTSEEEFFDIDTGIYAKFDKTNLIDFFLFNFFIDHLDFWNYNYFIVRNSNPSKFYLIPWDFDYSFRQMGGNFLSYSENHEVEIRRNPIYNRLIDNEEFMEDCKNRWIYLREEKWTEDNILDMLADYYEDIGEAYEIEKRMWDPEVVESKWDEKFEESVHHLKHYIPARIEYCDEYFSNY